MKLTSIALVLLLLTLLHAQEIGGEAGFRLLVREKNRLQVEAHNQKQGATYTMALHAQFADKTFQELKAIYLTERPLDVEGKLMIVEKPTSKSFFGSLGASNIYVNWTQKGVVPTVTNQGNCGSCYAHTGVADIQSSYLLKGIKVSLSIQQIVDCSFSFGNYGCQGGWMGKVFEYVIINGITLSQYYPQSMQTFYNGQNGTCVKKRGEFRLRNYAYTSLRIYDCQSLTNIVMKRPVSVAVYANFPFMYYKQGIFTGCDPVVSLDINHAMLVTGIVSNSVNNYWILRNSWGTQWGELGYMRVDRNIENGNACQICIAPHYSIL